MSDTDTVERVEQTESLKDAAKHLVEMRHEGSVRHIGCLGSTVADWVRHLSW
jgi:hypothetical protein